MRRLTLTSEERILFLRRLSLFLHAGIPIHTAFDLITEGTTRRTSALLIRSVSDEVRAGKSLATALARFPRTFDALTLGFIRMGEASGALAEHAGHAAALLERRSRLSRSMLSAAVYPFLIVCVTIGITLFLVLYAFPKMLPLFEGFHRTLPVSTRLLIAVTDMVAHHGVVLLGTCLAVACSLVYFQRFDRVRMLRDRILLGIPLLGVMVVQYHAVSIARTLSALLERGVPLLTALELVSTMISHTGYAAALAEIHERVSTGGRISEGFAAHERLFPIVLVQMVRTGEMTGTLPASLLSCAHIYEEYLDERIRMLSALIEPVLMIMMGLGVGFVALAIITPIYSLTQGIGIR